AGRLGPRSDCRLAALPYFRGIPDEREPYGILVWDARTGRALRRLVSPSGDRLAGSFRPRFTPLGCGCDGGLLVYELPSFQQRSIVRWDTVQKVHFSPDGQYLAAATISGLVKIWSTSTNREVATLTQSGDGSLHWLAFSDDGRALAMSGERTVRVWDLAGTTERQGPPGPVGGCAGARLQPGW